MLATFDHTQFELSALLAGKRGSVSVVVPTRETAATIAATVRAIDSLRRAGLVDQVLVVDADSADGTATIAREAGAEVFQEADLLPEFGQVAGKGDAMWRALSVARGTHVVYLDGDVRDFGAHYVTGLLGPLLQPSPARFVKGFYRRPLALDTLEIEDGGGRVTELTAKPLLELLAPELGAFRQPLAGEVAADRELLASLPFAADYGVEIAMLVDAWRAVGIGAMAQVDLGSKRNSHQSLDELGGMSRQVLAALARTLSAEPDPRLGAISPAPGTSAPAGVRPPLASLALSG